MSRENPERIAPELDLFQAWNRIKSGVVEIMGRLSGKFYELLFVIVTDTKIKHIPILHCICFILHFWVFTLLHLFANIYFLFLIT